MWLDKIPELTNSELKVYSKSLLDYYMLNGLNESDPIIPIVRELAEEYEKTFEETVNIVLYEINLEIVKRYYEFEY